MSRCVASTINVLALGFSNLHNRLFSLNCNSSLLYISLHIHIHIYFLHSLNLIQSYEFIHFLIIRFTNRIIIAVDIALERALAMISLQIQTHIQVHSCHLIQADRKVHL